MRPFLPDEASTPRAAKQRLPVQNRKRRFESRTETGHRPSSAAAASLAEVSRKLDGLLTNSRKLNDDLRTVRRDFNSFEDSLLRTSDDFRKTHIRFREMSRTPAEDPEEPEEVTRIIAAAFGCSSERSGLFKFFVTALC